MIVFIDEKQWMMRSLNKVFALSLALGMVACQPDPNVPELSDEFVMQEAEKVVASTEGLLKSTLQSKIKNEGFEAAVKYCHVNAQAISDSMSEQYKVRVRRTSFRYRNPLNMPDSLDRVILHSYEDTLESKGEIGVRIAESEKGIKRYYSPITVMPVCLNCHGMPGEELSADLHALILDEYPEDEAVGYSLGDLRGAWVVEIAPN